MVEPKLKAVDLQAVAYALPDKRKKLRQLIEHYRDIHSAYSDLSTAFEMLHGLRSAEAAANDGVEWAGSAITALTYSAIILYARATKTKGLGRHTFDIRTMLSAP